MKLFSKNSVTLPFIFLSTQIFANTPPQKIHIPLDIPLVTEETSKVFLNDNDGNKVESTINPALQDHLSRFIVDRGNPISASVVIDAKTGKILAMVQGRPPQAWGATSHTALHNLFPAASLFKTVVAAAAFDLGEVEPLTSFGLEGGCSDVRPTGVWLNDQVLQLRNQMTIYKAFGNSCNGFFAKLGVNNLGLKTIVEYAMRFGWDGKIASDFDIARSPLTPPGVRGSSAHAVGRFAAGFGSVGMSAVHAAWISLAIANGGHKRPVFIRQDSQYDLGPVGANNNDDSIMRPESADKIRAVMEATVRSGTASFAFKRGKHRILRELVGGKTGTLTGHSPEGITTWFTGMMPLNNPEIVVSSVVVLDHLWHIKAPNLAAEAFWAYLEYVKNPGQMAQHDL